MKTEKLELFNEILIIQMVHWTLYPLALTVIGIAGNYIGEGGPAGVLWGICGLLAVLYLFLRERVKRFIMFLLLHIGLAALFLLLPAQTIVERILCAACGVGYLIQSMMKRLRQEDERASGFSPVVAVVVCVVAILFQHYQGRMDWDFYYALTLVSVFAMYLISGYIQQYLNFLTVNKSSAGYMPAAEMFRSGMASVVLYAVFGAIVLLLLTGFEWVESLWTRIKNGLLALIRFLFSLFPHEQPVDDEVVILPAQSAAENDLSGLLEPTEPFWLWQILEVVAVIAFASFAAYVVVKAVIKAARYIHERFLEGYGSRSRIGTEEEQRDVREKCSLAKPASQDAGKRSLFGFMTPDQRIRRLYKKKILASSYELTKAEESREGKEGMANEKGAKENLPALSLLTARECGEKLMLPELALIYEQTRYSDKEATPEMLRAMRAAITAR